MTQPSDPAAVFAFSELIGAVRAMADQLDALAVDLHPAADVTAGERRLLLALRTGGAATMPRLAGELEVTRQYIRQTAVPLIERGLIERRPNPAHRRSDLLALTDQGQELLRGFLKREGRFLQTTVADLDRDELRATRDALRRIVERLAEGRKS